jgi:hypothetical protein
MLYEYKLNDDRKNGFVVAVEAQSVREADDKMEMIIAGQIDKYDIVFGSLCGICQEPLNGIVRVHHHN